jgi:hypothetical protein
MSDIPQSAAKVTSTNAQQASTVCCTTTKVYISHSASMASESSSIACSGSATVDVMRAMVQQCSCMSQLLS